MFLYVKIHQALHLAYATFSLSVLYFNKIHGILLARILKWVAFLFSRGSSQRRDQIQVFRTAGNSLQVEPQGKPKNTGVGSLSLLQEICPTRDRTQVSHIAGDSLPADSQETPKKPGVGSLSLLQQIFPTRVSRIEGRFFTNWIITEAQNLPKR